MASLDDFLRTGRLGPLGQGMPLPAVREVLGEAQDSGGRKARTIHKYGSLQLVFSRPQPSAEPVLDSILLYFRDPEEHPPDALGLTGWMPTRETTDRSFREQLDRAGIQVEKDTGAGPDRQLVLQSGVQVSFNQGHVYLISQFAKDGREARQLSVTLPKTHLEAIRREAKAQGISMSALCSRWIEERAANLQAH